MTIHNDNIICEQTKIYYYDYLNEIDKGKIPQKFLDHIGKCKTCQAEIERLDNILKEPVKSHKKSNSNINSTICEMLKLHFAYIGEQITCEAVKPFLPLLAGDVLPVSVPTPITVHIDKCRSCAEDLKTIRELKLTYLQIRELTEVLVEKDLNKLNLCKWAEEAIAKIVQRPNSNIITKYEVDEFSKDKISSESYAGFPVKVEAISSPSKQSLQYIGKETGKSIKLFSKFAAVAAVIILVAAALIYNMPKAKAIAIGQLYKTLEPVKNVHFIAVYKDKPDPIQEIWISKLSNVKVLKTEKEIVIFDINKKLKKSKDLSTNKIMNEKIGDESLTKTAITMTQTWSLLPFDSIYEVPSDASWQKTVNGDNIDATVSNADIYDLTWSRTTLSGAVVNNKWRGYIDKRTNLPKQIEFWQKYANESEYVLTTTISVSYPTDEEMLRFMEELGF